MICGYWVPSPLRTRIRTGIWVWDWYWHNKLLAARQFCTHLRNITHSNPPLPLVTSTQFACATPLIPLPQRTYGTVGDGTGRERMGWDGTRQNGTGRNGIGWDRTGRRSHICTYTSILEYKVFHLERITENSACNDQDLV